LPNYLVMLRLERWAPASPRDTLQAVFDGVHADERKAIERRFR
jgi:hypothetical protein